MSTNMQSVSGATEGARRATGEAPVSMFFPFDTQIFLVPD